MQMHVYQLFIHLHVCMYVCVSRQVCAGGRQSAKEGRAEAYRWILFWQKDSRGRLGCLRKITLDYLVGSVQTS